MSRTHKDAKNYKPKERHISVRAVRRDQPDLRKLGRAVFAIALAQAEAEADAANQHRTPRQKRKTDNA